MAEQILTVLLERSGYRVTRLGIEALFSEVKYLDLDRYLALGLPKQLRTLPDLLVADPGIRSAKLIEVKFRRRFDKRTADELFVTLTEQRQYWPQSYAIIMLGRPFQPASKFHQDFMRVIPPDHIDCLRCPRGVGLPSEDAGLMGQIWDQLPMITKVFRFQDFEVFGEQRDHHGRHFFREADSITDAIRELGRV